MNNKEIAKRFEFDLSMGRFKKSYNEIHFKVPFENGERFVECFFELMKDLSYTIEIANVNPTILAEFFNECNSLVINLERKTFNAFKYFWVTENYRNELPNYILEYDIYE